jgi:hypothetical protein
MISSAPEHQNGDMSGADLSFSVQILIFQSLPGAAHRAKQVTDIPMFALLLH